MRLHRGKIQEASQTFSFFLENSSTAPPVKQIGGVKGVTLLAIRIEAVAPLFDHVSEALPDIYFLGNTFCQ